MTLAAHYQFEEGSGTTLTDSSGFSHTGDNMLSTGDWITGREGSLAWNFDGNQRFNTPGWQGPQGTGDVSVAFWFKGTSIDPQTVIAWGSETTYGDRFSIGISTYGQSTGTGNFVFGTSYLAVGWAESPDVFDGAWHHITVVYTAAGLTLDLYIDAVLHDTTTLPGALDITNDNDLLVGDYLSGFWPGRLIAALDDLRIYTNALTQPQIAALISPDPTLSIKIGLRSSAATYKSFKHTIRVGARLGYDSYLQTHRVGAAIYRRTLLSSFRMAASAYQSFKQKEGLSSTRLLVPVLRSERISAQLINTFKNQTFVGFGHAVHITSSFRGIHRIAVTADDRYELFHGTDTDPDFDAAPWQTFTSLPYTTPALSAGHVHHLVLRKRNQYGLSSENIEAWIVDLAGDGSANPVTPSAPTQITVVEEALTDVTTKAQYEYLLDGIYQADQWLLYVRTDGTDPDPVTDDPYVETMNKSDAVARFSYTTPEAGVGSDYRVIVRVRRSGTPDVNSTNTTVYSVLTTGTGPDPVTSTAALQIPVMKIG